MPDAAEVDALVRFLDDRRDLREAIQAAHEGVFHRRAEAAREVEEFPRRQRRVADEQHAVLEPDRAQFGNGRVVGALAEVEDGHGFLRLRQRLLRLCETRQEPRGILPRQRMEDEDVRVRGLEHRRIG